MNLPNVITVTRILLIPVFIVLYMLQKDWSIFAASVLFALAAITERMIQAINFIGNKQEVTAFTNSYLEAGVQYPILMPMPWGQDRKLVTQLTLDAMAGINR